MEGWRHCRKAQPSNAPSPLKTRRANGVFLQEKTDHSLCQILAKVKWLGEKTHDKRANECCVEKKACRIRYAATPMFFSRADAVFLQKIPAPVSPQPGDHSRSAIAASSSPQSRPLMNGLASRSLPFLRGCSKSLWHNNLI